MTVSNGQTPSRGPAGLRSQLPTDGALETFGEIQMGISVTPPPERRDHLDVVGKLLVLTTASLPAAGFGVRYVAFAPGGVRGNAFELAADTPFAHLVVSGVWTLLPALFFLSTLWLLVLMPRAPFRRPVTRWKDSTHRQRTFRLLITVPLALVVVVLFLDQLLFARGFPAPPLAIGLAMLAAPLLVRPWTMRRRSGCRIVGRPSFCSCSLPLCSGDLGDRFPVSTRRSTHSARLRH